MPPPNDKVVLPSKRNVPFLVDAASSMNKLQPPTISDERA